MTLVAASVIGTLACSVFPALRSARRRDLIQAHRQGDPLGGRRRGQTLLIVQAASTFTLIAGAILMDRTIANLSHETGYDARHVISITVNLGSEGYRPDAEIRKIFRLLQDRAAPVPNVERTAVSSGGILRSLRDTAYVGIRGDAGFAIVPKNAVLGIPEHQAVSSDYFQTVGTRILHGRSFHDSDTSDSAPVVIVDEGVAATFCPTGMRSGSARMSATIRPARGSSASASRGVKPTSPYRPSRS